MADISKNKPFNVNQRETMHDLLDTDSEEERDGSEKHFEDIDSELVASDTLSHTNGIRQQMSSDGVSRNLLKINSPLPEHMFSDTDSGNSYDDNSKKRKFAGEYDPNTYKDMEVSDEIKDLFQYITKYIPQNLNLEYKFKPFIPEYIPAVGDIDAFLKVIIPEEGSSATPDQSYLGLTVLDEPSAVQSDPALLHLQLRASSVNSGHNMNIVVKKVKNVEKSAKIIDKWIKDISDLHKTKSSPIVKYTNPMPEIEDLMQEWPSDVENLLKVHGFPSYKHCPSLAQYIDIVCCIFDIPVYKNRIQSLHVLFSLYAAIKNSQLYKASNNFQENEIEFVDKITNADQLVLE